MHLIQLKLPSLGRCLGVVNGAEVRSVTQADKTLTSVYAAFNAARQSGQRLGDYLQKLLQTIPPDTVLNYHQLLAEEMVLAPVSEEPDGRLLVSGTGLTHLGSVQQRDDMHRKQDAAPKSDSRKMFEMGLAGGKSPMGQRGAAPEWFYKGDGRILRGPGQPLDIPSFAPDGGEEPEIAVVYVIDREGVPWRIGFVQGNEWSDHVTENINYLYLAPSKLRSCAIGPELVTDLIFDEVRGQCRVTRHGVVLYDSGELLTGESNMCHSLANIEDHHFKFAQHRQPGDIHIHFLGTSKLSFQHRSWTYQSGDMIEVSFQGLGEPLRNPVLRAQPDQKPLKVAQG